MPYEEGSNELSGFKIVFQQLTTVWTHKKKKLSADIKSTESLILAFSHTYYKVRFIKMRFYISHGISGTKISHLFFIQHIH